MTTPSLPEQQQRHPRVRRGIDVPAKPDVSIIVLVTTDTDRVKRCLDSIAMSANDGPLAEILVLANGTPSNALETLGTRDDIVLIRSAVNHGFGGGCNWAAGLARGPRLVFINDDAVGTPGWLAALDAALDADPRIGVAGSRVLLRDGRLQEAGNVIWRDGSTSHLGRTLPADEPRLLARRDVDYVSFCSAMVRREAWDQVGGFDERYFPAYYEDADLCMSARALGWRVVCEPASVVIHDEGGSTSLRFRHFLSGRNQRLFAAKWGPAMSGFDERPRRPTGRAVLQAALRRQTPTIPRAADEPGTRNRAEFDEPQVMALEMLHLVENVAIKDEYAAFLAAQLDAFGATALARKAYRTLRRGFGRETSGHRVLPSAVEKLRAWAGGRQ